MSALQASLDSWRAAMSQEHVHIPVMVAEVVELLGGSVEADRNAGLIVDGTLGAGGHSAQLLERLPGASVLGTDQDPQVLELAREHLSGSTKKIAAFNFRAVSPLFHNRPFSVHLKSTESGLDLWAANADGGLAMQCQATLS